jgi:hypothetical protein
MKSIGKARGFEFQLGIGQNVFLMTKLYYMYNASYALQQIQIWISDFNIINP